MTLDLRTFRGITYTVKTSTLDNQTLIGTPSPDWFETLGVNNNIITGSGNDVILTDVDFLYIDDYSPYGGEAVFYSPRSVTGDDIVFAGDGDDYLVTGGGNNLVFLGQGNDIFDGAFRSGGSNDTIYAGQGDDIIDDVNGGGNKTVYGGSGNDRIRAGNYDGSGDISIYAGSGNNSISGFGANVIIDAGTGNDFIDGTGTNVIINAGTGNDDIVANGKVIAGPGDDFIGLYTFSSFGYTDSAYGGTGSDTIFTLSFDPSEHGLISGGSGNDKIISGIGSDTIYDDQGNDVINLRGGSVNLRDSLVDYFGDTVLEVPGGGNDTVYAGTGYDTFILGLGDGVSTIIGYSADERIDLTGLGLSSSDVSLSQNGLDTFLNVGADQVAILEGTQVNSVAFFV
jgi:Ca2+-binding RTX toxin-like protein